MDGDARAALVVAVVLCLAGDVALLGDSDERFLVGLGAFALGHVAYVVTALLVGVSWPRLAVAFPVLAVLLGFQAATRMLPGARRHGGPPMLVAVAVYSLIISAMVVTATGTPSWLAVRRGDAVRRQRLDDRLRPLRPPVPPSRPADHGDVPRRPAAAHRRPDRRRLSRSAHRCQAVGPSAPIALRERGARTVVRE